MNNEIERLKSEAQRVGMLRLAASGGFAYVYAVEFKGGMTVFPELEFKTSEEYSCFASKCGNGNGNVSTLYAVYYDAAVRYLKSN